MNRRRMVIYSAVLLVVGAGLALAACFPTSVAGDTNWGFSLNNLDHTCKPCENFYEFAMGGWMKSNPIPAEYPSWGTFAQLRDNNLTAMRSILDTTAASRSVSGSNDQKIGDFYASCMATTATEAAGAKPLTVDFAAIEAISDRKSLDAEIAR